MIEIMLPIKCRALVLSSDTEVLGDLQYHMIMPELFSHLAVSPCDLRRGVYQEQQNRADGYWY